MDAKTILVNNSSLFSPLRRSPLSHLCCLYRRITTLKPIQHSLRLLCEFSKSSWFLELTGGGRQSSPSGLPRDAPHMRGVVFKLSPACAMLTSGERITHAPISLGYTREHNTICHRGHAKISGVILIPEPEHERRHRRRPRQLLPQHLRREAPPWCVGTRRSRSAGSDACGVMHMAIPTLVAVRDLRHAPQIPSRELDITYFPDSTVLTYPEVAPSRPFPINTVCRRVVSLVL
ncbi:hypothetical protein B0H11DRAFT_2223775 [Mycena galericulata]|nr:hypothetical protein B0H11DRAFT_2223775 [Mycena galericulata]